MNEVGKNYLRLLKSQLNVIENNDLYGFIFYTLNPIIGNTPSILTILNGGEEIDIYSLIESYERKTVTYADKNVDVITILRNITNGQNLLSGLTIAEYNDVVRYVVVTYWRTYNGQIVTSKESRYDDNIVNKDQERVIDMIFQYPYLLTIVLMENQSFTMINSAIPVPHKPEHHKREIKK
jgi:hypothetical protein